MADPALALTASLLDRHRYRLPGTPECRAAAHDIADLLRLQCDDVREEPFTMHPGSLWNAGRAVALAYLLAGLLLTVSGRLAPLALLVGALALVYAATHYVFCGRWFDRAFAAAEGINVVGVIEPAAEVRQQVLVVGHHDSPYVTSFLARAQRLARLRLTAAMLAYAALLLWSAALTVAPLLGQAPPPLRDGYLVATLVGLCFVAPLYCVIARTPSPGAGDNLIASAIAVGVATHFAGRRARGEPLRHTRLVLLSTDGEEAGQRGAIAYAERHAAELRGVASSVLNLDSLYRLSDLAVLTRDRHGTRPLSARMVQECRDLAAGLGYALAPLALPLGGGGTDAAAFARAGIAATTIVAVSTSPDGSQVYHTAADTADRIEPAVVAAVSDLAVGYVLLKDAGAGAG